MKLQPQLMKVGVIPPPSDSLYCNKQLAINNLKKLYENVLVSPPLLYSGLYTV